MVLLPVNKCYVELTLQKYTYKPTVIALVKKFIYTTVHFITVDDPQTIGVVSFWQ